MSKSSSLTSDSLLVLWNLNSAVATCRSEHCVHLCWSLTWTPLPLPVLLQVELSCAPPPGFQRDRDRNTSISSSQESNKDEFCASKTLCTAAMSVSSNGGMADSAWSHQGFASISSSTSSSICVLQEFARGTSLFWARTVLHLTTFVCLGDSC